MNYQEYNRHGLSGAELNEEWHERMEQDEREARQEMTKPESMPTKDNKQPDPKTMNHTIKSIAAVLESNDEAVRRGLRTVKSICGYCHGGWSFARSLINQMDEGKELTKPQLTAARKLLLDYLPVLRNTAVKKAAAKKKAADEENRRWDEAEREYQAEREAEGRYERYLENQNDLYYHQHYGNEPDFD